MKKTSLGDLARAFWRPALREQQAATEAAWERLPEGARGPDQVLGTVSSGCAATHGVQERCNLWCSACYLASEANQAPPLPFEEVRAQLESIREFLGPWGNTQITAGEVTLLPCDELVRILQTCRELELSPMLMTNGTVLLEDPAYLERLVLEGGLDNLAIHVDTTQAGREDGPRKDAKYGGDERLLHPLRGRFAQLLRDTRRRTNKPLAAAHTVTVTQETLDSVPDVVRWTLAHADAFRMLSFQPAANVGRTAAAGPRGGREALWARICEGLGIEANDAAWHFGDPDCSNVVLMFVVDPDGSGSDARRRLVEVTRRGARVDRWFFRRLIAGPMAGWRPAGEGWTLGAARLLGRLARAPWMLLEAAGFCLYRAWTDRGAVAAVLGGLLRAPFTRRLPRVHPFVLVVHHFMDADELATERGQERLAACAFRVPVNGEMVSMCEVNATDLRARLNDQARADQGSPRSPADPRPTATTGGSVSRR